jgi:hypothetical protein
MKTFHPIKKRSVYCMYVVGIILLMTACTRHQKFDQTKWHQKNEGGLYTYRNAMLGDLMHHYHLKGRSYDNLISLIGKPENDRHQSPNKLSYNVVKEYGSDITPVYVKNLLIRLNSDGVVYEVGIETIKNN